jgi:hypothetical protein
MNFSYCRGYLLVATIIVTTACDATAETIAKLNLGPTGGADVRLSSGILSTVNDGNSSPGDQETSVTFHGFVIGQNGIADITLPSQGSFTLSGVAVDGLPNVTAIGGLQLLTQPTMGGSFSLYDQAGALLLEGTLVDGSLNGITGASATGGFLTANLGTFTGPSTAGLDPLFDLLDPKSASLSMPFTDVVSTGPSGSVPGLMQGAGGALLNFRADASVNIGAGALGQELPEPSGLSLACLACLGLLRLRSKRN